MEKWHLMATVVLIGLTVRWTVSLNSYSGNTSLLFKRWVNIPLNSHLLSFLPLLLLLFVIVYRYLTGTEKNLSLYWYGQESTLI